MKNGFSSEIPDYVSILIIVILDTATEPLSYSNRSM